MNELRELLRRLGYTCAATLTARVQLPVIPTISAQVEETKG